MKTFSTLQFYNRSAASLYNLFYYFILFLLNHICIGDCSVYLAQHNSFIVYISVGIVSYFNLIIKGYIDKIQETVFSEIKA